MEKINVAELLRNCPKGMELDCTMFNNVVFDHISTEANTHPIFIKVKNSDFTIQLTMYGQYMDIEDAKCVIFPKGKTTWEGFVPPSKFKDGDVVRYSDCIAIFKEWGDATLFRTYVTAYLHGDSTIDVAIPLFGKLIRREAYLATEEEKAKLFQAIKDKGYKWNPVTKTLEKLPKFKVGNKVKRKGVNYTYIVTIVGIYEEYYTYVNQNGEPASISIKNQDEWELVPNKFDITTLVPFKSRVLVRDNDKEKWHPAFWGFHDVNSGYPYKLIGCIARYCIPYEGNKHLLGTTDDCDEYFKTWE